MQYKYVILAYFEMVYSAYWSLNSPLIANIVYDWKAETLVVSINPQKVFSCVMMLAPLILITISHSEACFGTCLKLPVVTQHSFMAVREIVTTSIGFVYRDSNCLFFSFP